MKRVFTLFAALICALSFSAQTPEPRTAVIKSPAADNHDAYFSTNTNYHFEVYKPGTAEDVAAMVASFANDGMVASCTAGKRTGDYQAIDLVVKKPYNKQWFMVAFKRAGITQVKINNEEPVPAGKL